MFWVLSVYFNVRNILPKSGTFQPGHPVYIFLPTPLRSFFQLISMLPFPLPNSCILLWERPYPFSFTILVSRNVKYVLGFINTCYFREYCSTVCFFCSCPEHSICCGMSERYLESSFQISARPPFTRRSSIFLLFPLKTNFNLMF